MEITKSDIIERVSALSRIRDAASQITDEGGQSPFVGSKAMMELASLEGNGHLYTAFNQGKRLIEAADDNLQAFIKTVTEPIQTIAPWICVRALLEATALSCWLLDSGIDAHERLKRSFAFRYKGIDQQMKIADLVGKQGRQVGKSKLDGLESEALKLGIHPVIGKKGKMEGKRISIGLKMLPITDFISDVLDQEYEYRMTSAVAHAHDFALNQLGYRKLEKSEMLGVTFDEKHLDLTAIALLCYIASNNFVKAVRAEFELFKWNIEKFNDLAEPHIKAVQPPK